MAACLLLGGRSGAGILGGYEFAQSRAAHAGAAGTATVAIGGLPNLAAPAPTAPAERLPAFQDWSQPEQRRSWECATTRWCTQRMEGSLDDPAIRPTADAGERKLRRQRECADGLSGLFARSAGGTRLHGRGIRDALMVGFAL